MSTIVSPKAFIGCICPICGDRHNFQEKEHRPKLTSYSCKCPNYVEVATAIIFNHNNFHINLMGQQRLIDLSNFTIELENKMIYTDINFEGINLKLFNGNRILVNNLRIYLEKKEIIF